MTLSILAANILRLAVLLFLAGSLLSGSSMPPGKFAEQVRFYTRQVEFNYVSWTLNALALKARQFALGSSAYLSGDLRNQFLVDYLNLISRYEELEWELSLIYADPQVADPQAASAALRQELDELKTRQQREQSLAEAILQGQVGQAAARMGLTLGGQPIPPVMYHTTPLPLALIVSPRDKIQRMPISRWSPT
jgi:hypothetical protein